MVNILPIPEDVLYIYGLFKLACAGIGFLLFGLLVNKSRKKHSRIIHGFLLVLLAISIGNLFSSFDYYFGWRDLLGSYTWLGYGIGTIINAFGNIVYFWLYIDIFPAVSKWNNTHKVKFAIFASFELLLATFMMTYYLVGFPPTILVPSIAFIGLTAIVYLCWIFATFRIMKGLREPRDHRKFKYLLMMAVLFFGVIICLSIASMSDLPSYFSIIGLVLMIIGLIFAYLGVIQ